MAKGPNQKLKLLYLMKIFMEETDEQHPLTMPEIISKLNACGINADRKTLYMDFEELRTFGLDIISEKQGRKWNYYIGARDFELPELKLLVDSVQSAKFMTDRKSNELIQKIESLASRHDAKKLQRQVFIAGRVKTINESIYYNVDKLHEAIASDRRSQIGSGDRSEKIRTYNYPQSRVTDHRIGLTLYKLDEIMNGDLDEIIDALVTAQRAEQLKEQMN